MTVPVPGASDLRRALRRAARAEKIPILSSFFKTGPGDYGAGDRFLGVPVPEQRRIAKAHGALPLASIAELLKSPVHEERLTALFVLLIQFYKAPPLERFRLHRFYLRRLRRVNNWDLVDSSAATLVGEALEGKSLALLDRLARSKHLWTRRVAMIATFHFTKKGDPRPAIRIAERLLSDKHDLIHKAVGWMLREVGKRCSERSLTDFLDRHAPHMPRTALRYAIERLPTARRKAYLVRRDAGSSALS